MGYMTGSFTTNCLQLPCNAASMCSFIVPLSTTRIQFRHGIGFVFVPCQHQVTVANHDLNILFHCLLGPLQSLRERFNRISKEHIHTLWAVLYWFFVSPHKNYYQINRGSQKHTARTCSFLWLSHIFVTLSLFYQSLLPHPSTLLCGWQTNVSIDPCSNVEIYGVYRLIHDHGYVCVCVCLPTSGIY